MDKVGGRMTPIWLEPMTRWEAFGTIKESVMRGAGPVAFLGLGESQKCHMLASVLYPLERNCLYITSGDVQARRIYEDLSFFYPGKVVYLPEREMLLYDVAARSLEITQRRVGVLEKLLLEKDVIVVASIEALMSLQTPPQIFKDNILTIKTGDVLSLTRIASRLVQMGYERVSAVEGKGQFSIRGGILDIFPLTADDPYRIEFFDDEVDSIRTFDVLSQRSIENCSEAIISPASELVLTADSLARGKDNISRSYSEFSSKAGRRNISASLKEKIERVLNALDEGVCDGSLERYFSFFYPERATVFDYLYASTLIVLDEPARIRERCQGYFNEFQEHFKELLQRFEVLPRQSELILDYSEFLRKLSGHACLMLQILPTPHPDFEPRAAHSFAVRIIPSYHGKLQLLAEDIELWLKKGYYVLFLLDSQARREGIAAFLREHGIQSLSVQNMEGEFQPGQVVVAPGILSHGFEYLDARFVVISDREIYGVQRRRVQPRKKARKLESFMDLKVGDYVVHENHGIGKYLGIKTLVVDGQKKDYLYIKYAGTDKLYVPTDQLDLIQPYIGMGDEPPKLSKLGGAEWQRTKNRVRQSVQKLAIDLVKLYAIRQSVQGHRFSPDTEWQKQFEALFPYQETPDQLQAIEDVKRDMESSKVMDRLICGDVGYGKTEVAIRAAFKAVMDGKQVAVLVPTTILAQQHYNTFVKRFEAFPFTIQVLSRFKTPAEQKAILKALKEGNIDVIIGTHRLLGKDVKFKDLGLLIIDEEQRFGVAHKEMIKDIKKNVDVLTLTATPIPRTLHMSLMGIRDISIIETPPEDRYPVQTYVVEYSEPLIRDAILRELQRGGQVYFVYNRVKSMDWMLQELRKLVPEAKIAMAHGQMSENLLEKVMMDFYENRFDVLLCSSIIENGLDIPNVNTIIVYDADCFGLAQLYQLRGRVGRSNRLAYAYFTYRKDKIISEQAEKRLQAIKEFTEFGAGFKIAMRDLEIRGVGNLLGPEQHGHMAAVGYDLYCKLLEEAIRTMKGEKLPQPVETIIDIKVNAYIEEDYIPDENHKIEVYKKIAAIEGPQDKMDVEEELVDRFGDIPPSVQNLIDVAYVKALAKRMRIAEIAHRGKEVKMRLVDAKAIPPNKLMVILNENRRQIDFASTPVPVLTVRLKDSSPNAALQAAKDAVEKLVDYLN
ncbi:transcription-repair coupling factor [Caldicoprobacter algeriensis]|uniref:transcription-repair coupling factor n=1 Tax=Caldicoprobacter algeriensis TaxID=699281 RepID=UPI00207A896E